jgi:hypothetical protein
LKGFARRAFVVGTWMVVAAVLVQILLAGLGVFDHPGFFYWHANVNGAVVFFLPLLVVLIGWYGRVPGRLLLLTAAVPGLVIVQSLLLLPYHMSSLAALRPLSALHVLNALLIFWVAVQAVERSRRLDATQAISEGEGRSGGPHER